MKRLFALVIAVLLIVGALSACGGQSGQTANVDLKGLLDSINSQYSLNDLKVLESASDLNRYYSIDESSVKQFAAELTTSASVFSEVIIIEANDSSAVSDIAAKLESHLDAQLNTAKSYTQDAVAMLESCTVAKNGNFVYLAIGDNAEGISGMIEAAING